jgi:hypothetical protein
MTNQELYAEIKNLRNDVKNVEDEVKGLTKEFYLFKGKAFGFITILTGVFTFVGNYLVKKL